MDNAYIMLILYTVCLNKRRIVMIYLLFFHFLIIIEQKQVSINVKVILMTYSSLHEANPLYF
jgi:hypothetical protein